MSTKKTLLVLAGTLGGLYLAFMLFFALAAITAKPTLTGVHNVYPVGYPTDSAQALDSVRAYYRYQDSLEREENRTPIIPKP